MKLPSRTVPDLASQLNFEKLERTVDSEPVTSLPTTDLYVGRRIVYVADAANGVYWDLVLTDPNATYPWAYVGGASLVNTVDTFGTRLSTAYGDLTAGTGPVVTPPLAGDYAIEYGAHIRNDTINQDSFISFSVGATAALDADSTQNWSGSASGAGWGQGKVLVKTIPAAAQAIQLKYRSTAGTASYRNRWLKVTPVRVG